MTVTPSRALVIAPVVLALALTLSGCAMLGTHPSDGSSGSPVVAPAPSSTAPSTVPSSAASPAATPDAATLDGISQDLGDAGTANSQADANARAGDQAAGTGDEP